MPRIFGCLAFTNLLLLFATGGSGIFAGHVSVDRHVMLAVFTLLFSCMIQVVTFTYLTVTGKMVGQAVHLASLNNACLHQVKQIKRKMTRCLGVVFMSIVFVTATGASGWRTAQITFWHDIATGVTVVVHIAALWLEFEIVVANANVVSNALSQYSQVRAMRGDQKQSREPLLK